MKREISYWIKKRNAHLKRADSLMKRAAKSSDPHRLIAQAKGERAAAARAFAKWREENPNAMHPDFSED